jgi:FkbM family methyltransferase
MRYNSRDEVELIGKSGVFTYDGFFPDATPFKVSRILSSYWVCTRPVGPDLAELLMKDGFWESWITLWMSNNVKPGSVCIDVGANYGYYTFFLAQHGCKVISIEANPELIKYLEKSVELNSCSDRVRIFNKAVADRSWKTVYLNIDENAIGGSSIMPRGDGKKILVETMMLNDILLFEPKIDFVKMDIEGAEEQAWEGVKRIMETNNGCCIIIEFSPICYRNEGRDFFALLKNDYDVTYVNSDGVDKPVTDFSFFEKDLNEFEMLVIRNKGTK